MPYVDERFYNEEFHGEPVDSAGFPSLCRRAGEIVEEMTMYRLTPETMPLMTGGIQERIRQAVCAQIEYLDANGGSEIDNGGDLQSAGLGKFSYSKASGANGSTRQSVYAPMALRIMTPTGLLYRGGGCP